MVAIGDPKAGESIYDPCLGMGGLLMQAAQHVHTQTSSGSPHAWEDLQRSVFAGVEKRAYLSLVAGVRLRLAGVKQPRLYCGDALESPSGSNGGTTFDCIFADLPFGLRIERPVSSQYRFPARSGETLFLQHILGALKPGGRAVVLVPQSLLFRKGAETRLREWLLTEFRLDAVVSLPPGVLKPYSNVSCSLLVIHRQPPREKVLFINDGHVAFILDHQKAALAAGATARMDELEVEVQRRVGLSPREVQPAHATENLQSSMRGIENVRSLRYELLTLALRVREGLAGEREIIRATLQRLMPAPEQAGEDYAQPGDRRDENNRALAELIEHFLDETANPVPPAWKNALVPIRRLADRNWELLEKEAGLDRLDDFLKRITDLLPDTRNVPLRECAEVFNGISYTRKDTEDDLLLGVERILEVKLVRVQDLLKTEAESEFVDRLFTASKKFKTHVEANIPEKQLLQETDLVVSTSGTIGRVALVGKGIERTVVSNGLAVIRCKDPLLGHFIGYLLLTEPYQEWLGSHSTGSAVRHLRVTALRELPVPVVPRAAQLAVVRSGRAKHNEESFLDVLSQREGASPVLNFVLENHEIRAISGLAEEIESEAALPLLRRVLKTASDLNKGSSQTKATDAVATWLANWVTEIRQLVRLLEAAPSLTRYAMLQAWVNKHNSRESGHGQAVASLESELGNGTKSDLFTSAVRTIQRLTVKLTKLVNAESHKMLDAVKLSAGIDPSIVAAGRAAEVTLTLRNEGVLPLADVIVIATNLKGPAPNLPRRIALPSLVPESPYQLACQIEQNAAGVVPIEIKWIAKRVDLSLASGELSLAVEVRTLREAARPAALKRSPYIVGSPIDPGSRMFFGREDVIGQINRALRTEGPSTVILLEGNRRVGKSSLLKQIATKGLTPDWVPLYVSFQGFDGKAGRPGMATSEIFYGIAKELVVAAVREAASFRLPDVEGEIPLAEGMDQTKFFIKKLRPVFAGDNPFECFRLIVEAVLEAKCELWMAFGFKLAREGSRKCLAE